MTTTFQSDDGILTNNDSESYNFRMKKAHGEHPNLPKFIKALINENSVVELNWLQRDQPHSTKARRPEDRQRIQNRRDWEAELVEGMESGMLREKLLELADRMIVINRRVKKKKKFAPSYPNNRGQGRGRGRGRGPIRNQTRPVLRSSSSSFGDADCVAKFDFF